MRKLNCSEEKSWLGLIEKYKQNPTELNMNERFICEELMESIRGGDEAEIQETVAYLMQEIVREGEVNVKGSHFYLGDYRLMDGDEIEFIIDGSWCRTMLITVDNEDYLDLFGLKAGKDKVYARMRG